MVRLISYPFRVASDGSIATTEDGMDYYAEELAMLTKTTPGERELVPDYGIEDPTFNDFNRMDLLEKVAIFGPPVQIHSTSSKFTRDGRIVVNISYDEIPIGESSGLSDDFEDEYYYDEDDFDTEESDDDIYDEQDPSFNFNDATDL